MKNFSNAIGPGIMLGKENGLTLMLDAEVYDYAFSPQRGEGFKASTESLEGFINKMTLNAKSTVLTLGNSHYNIY